MIRIEYTNWKEDPIFLEKVQDMLGKGHNRRWSEQLWSAQWRREKIWSVELRRGRDDCRFIWQVNNPELELWFLLHMPTSAVITRRTLVARLPEKVPSIEEA